MSSDHEKLLTAEDATALAQDVTHFINSNPIDSQDFTRGSVTVTVRRSVEVIFNGNTIATKPEEVASALANLDGFDAQYMTITDLRKRPREEEGSDEEYQENKDDDPPKVTNLDFYVHINSRFEYDYSEQFRISSSKMCKVTSVFTGVVKGMSPPMLEALGGPKDKNGDQGPTTSKQLTAQRETYFFKGLCRVFEDSMVDWHDNDDHWWYNDKQASRPLRLPGKGLNGQDNIQANCKEKGLYFANLKFRNEPLDEKKLLSWLKMLIAEEEMDNEPYQGKVGYIVEVLARSAASKTRQGKEHTPGTFDKDMLARLIMLYGVKLTFEMTTTPDPGWVKCIFTHPSGTRCSKANKLPRRRIDEIYGKGATAYDCTTKKVTYDAQPPVALTGPSSHAGPSSAAAPSTAAPDLEMTSE